MSGLARSAGGRATTSQSEARADTASTNERAYQGPLARELELVSVCVGYGGQSQELEVG